MRYFLKNSAALFSLTAWSSAFALQAKTENPNSTAFQFIDTSLGRIPISAAVTAALITAVLALLGTLWKIFLDRNFQKKILRLQERWRARANAASRKFETSQQELRQDFERKSREEHATFETGEREQRQNFEGNERRQRQVFEHGETRARQTFEHELAQSNAAQHLENEKELHSYIQNEKYRLRWLERMLANVELASQQLFEAMTGLEAIIDTGPYLKNLPMVKQTTKVMDVFGDFQNTVKPLSVPVSISNVADHIITKMTEVLISLSPLKEIRETEDRKILLQRLKAELRVMTDEFLKTCDEFQRDPMAFVNLKEVKTTDILV